jgi:hypothetical protein
MTGQFPPCALLIASVGNRDPEYKGELTGPVRSALALQPETVVLLWNTGISPQADATRVKLTKELPGVRVELEEVPEEAVADLNALQPVFGDVLRRVMVRNPKVAPALVAVCPSSGTPQIQAALMAAAEALLPGSYQYQALDPRKAAEPLLRPLDPNLLNHIEELRGAFVAFADCNFTDARRAFETLLARPTAHLLRLRPVLLAARSVAATLQSLGHLEREEARTSALEVAMADVPISVRSEVGELVEWVRALEGGLTSNWAVELASRANRLARSGQRVEAHVAAAGAIEVSVNARLLQSWQIDSEHLTPPQVERLKASSTLERSLASYPTSIRMAENLHIALGVVEPAYKSWLQNRAGPGGLKLEARRKTIAEVRNKAVHEGRSVPHEFPALAFDYIDALAGYFGWTRPTQCPTAPLNVEVIAIALAAECGITLPA